VVVVRLDLVSEMPWAKIKYSQVDARHGDGYGGLVSSERIPESMDVASHPADLEPATEA